MSRVSEWYREHLGGWEIDVAAQGNLFSLVLRNPADSSSPSVNVVDAGVGLSQILAIVVQRIFENEVYEEGDEWVPIEITEQPELHLHPGAHASIADLYVGAVARQCGSFIVETHSENFILRLRRRVVEGRLPAEDVRIYWIDPDPRGGGSLIKPIDITPDGDVLRLATRRILGRFRGARRDSTAPQAKGARRTRRGSGMKVVFSRDALDDPEHWRSIDRIFDFFEDTRHVLGIDDIDDVLASRWLTSEDSRTNRRNRELLEKSLTDAEYSTVRGSRAHALAITVASVTDEQDAHRLSPDDARACLDRPVYLVLEDTESDGAFVRQLVRAYERDDLARALAQDWLELRRGGGSKVPPRSSNYWARAFRDPGG